MKKIFKIFGIILLVFIAVIILLTVIAKIKEKEIADIVLKKISKSIKAPITIDDISLNLIRRFPLATVELKGVWLGSADAFNVSDSLITEEETLASIQKFFISVKTKPLFKGDIEIMRVDIRGVDLNYLVDRNGVSNIDFLMDTTQSSSTDTTSINLKVLLKELTLRDIHCNYYDTLNRMGAQLDFPRAKITGEIDSAFLVGSVKGTLKLTNCIYDSTNLYLMQETKMDFDLSYTGDTIDVKKLQVKTDGADLFISGRSVIRDTLKTDFQIQGNHIDIGELIKYAPENMLAEYGIQKISGLSDINASIKGFVADSLMPRIKMNFALKKGYVQVAGYPSVKNISVTGDFTNGEKKSNKTTAINIRKFHAETNHSSLDISGILNNLDRIHYQINSGLLIDLAEFKKFIPDSLMQDVRGIIFAKVITKGVVPDSIGDDFIDYVLNRTQADMTLNNLYLKLDSALSINSLSGRLGYDLNHITIRNLKMNVPLYKVNITNVSLDAQFSGKLSDPLKMGIDLKSFQLKTDSCMLYCSAKIQNFEAPEFDFKGNIRLNLNEIKNMLPDSLANNLSGEITAQIVSSGRLNPDSITDQINDLVFNKSEFQIDFDKVSLDMPDTLMNVSQLSGRLSMKPDTIKIEHTRGVYYGIDFGIDSTSITNLYNSVILNQPSKIRVDTRLYLGDLDYTTFAPYIAPYLDTTATAAVSDTSTAENTDSIPTNYTYNIKGKIFAKSVTYKKARIENISALYNLSDSLYIVDQFKFDGFGGKHNTSMIYRSNPGNVQKLSVKNSITNMNVVSLLKDFDNFQEFYTPELTYNNISGVLSSNLDFQILFKDDSMIWDKTFVLGSFKLEKGGIYNYKPVMEMEPYLPKAISDLKVLEFKTINTNLFVIKDTIYVPSTLIVSNKLDATALGWQNFKGDYSYHLIVFLSEIITGKSNRINKKQDRMGEDVSDTGHKKNGTLVKSEYLKGESKSGLDNPKEQQRIANKIKSAEFWLKLYFYPKLANYSTDVN